MKLGKLKPRLDLRTLRLAKYLDLGNLPPIPPARAWDSGIADWGEMMNDQVRDCTCAAAAHQIQAWTAANGAELTPADADVLAAYEAVSGYNPADPNSDLGAAELVVLNYWRQTGIIGHQLAAFAAVQPLHSSIVMAALNLFGGLYIGLDLPICAQNQQVWSPAADDTGRAGSWGGHAVVVLDYDPNYLTCVTWGKLQPMTWAFFRQYCDEAYAVLSADWAAPGKVAPSGFDFAALQADLKIATAD
jgi:hypothetical protein